jgi:hypothetical protein
MIRKETFYRAACDSCGRSVDLDGGEYSDTRAGALAALLAFTAAIGDRWVHAQEFLLCPDCHAGGSGGAHILAAGVRPAPARRTKVCRAWRRLTRRGSDFVIAGNETQPDAGEVQDA